MNRRIWTGAVAGVLAAALLLTVGLGAYRAGQDDETVTRVVTEASDGEVVRVVGDGHHWGPGPGFFLIPLLIVLLLVLFARGRHHHGWHGPGGGPGWHRGPGWGPGGPGGPGACGPYGGRAVEEGRWEWVPGRRDDPADPAGSADPGEAVATPADPPTPRP